MRSADAALAVQWLAIDTYNGAPLPRNPQAGRVVPGGQSKPVPIVRLFGVAAEGQSVCLHVHGFTPYLYADAPAAFDEANAANVEKLRDELDRSLKARLTRGDDKMCARAVLGVEVVRDKASIMGYTAPGAPRAAFFKIYLALPGMIPPMKKVLGDGVPIPGQGRLQLRTYESNVPFVLRFMIDMGITGCSWLELPRGSFSERKPTEKKSRCQREVDVVFDSVVAHAPEGAWSKLAPIRILAFDIECAGRKGHFPDALHDPVIQISCVVHEQGRANSVVDAIFTLKGCLPINGAEVVTSATENDMLLKWASFVRAVDPDIITGYNTQNFDIPYVLKRAKVLQRADSRMAAVPELGRILGAAARMRDTTFQSAAFGKRENVETTVDGRVMFDLFPYMCRNHKLSSYSLNSVCAEFLGQQKEDVHHSIIAELQGGSDADRRRLAVYCLKDSQLVIRLMNKLAVLINYIEMARVTHVPLDYLLARGQQIKVFAMLLAHCRTEGLVVPNISKAGQSEDAKYEGATVIEPLRAFYEEPIATLDFASLYPSIMQAYNLCYSTLISAADAAKMPPGSYNQSPECVDGRHYFVTAALKKGVLPQILEDLLAARKRAKADMKLATDPMEYAVQNGRQLALKVSANSVYGFTGATVGQLPCLPIASTTTAYGRELLLQTKAFVEQHYPDATVVYGDTDSVMIKFGAGGVPETMVLARQVAERVTAIFPRPVKLEFEKVYFPYLLMNKKRYAGLLWTQPDKHDYLDAKGLETVRRDNCLLVRQLIDTCLRKIIIDRDTAGAIAHAKKTISNLLQNKIDISLLVISKSLSKLPGDADYKMKSAHAELAARMRERDAGTAPNLGDRVPYVIIQGAKGMPAYEKAEDPVFVLENNLPIDAQHYLDNQLSKPLERIFEPIIRKTSELLHGDHTRVVSKPTPVARKGGIMMFTQKTLKCLGCKALIDSGTVCAHCKKRERSIYVKRLREVDAHEVEFARLWTQCQRCQGSLHQDVLCTNSDCPIFYKRKKVQQDLKDSGAHLARFDHSW
ncbi:DNA polymerase family B-domain-containing protein [Pelagophyceae sp. CCMP2097]|nr:DNA polymerase family B-domain-containing protein [Pelagophyceae sp. CCMP2097]